MMMLFFFKPQKMKILIYELPLVQPAPMSTDFHPKNSESLQKIDDHEDHDPKKHKSTQILER